MGKVKEAAVSWPPANMVGLPMGMNMAGMHVPVSIVPLLVTPTPVKPQPQQQQAQYQQHGSHGPLHIVECPPQGAVHVSVGNTATAFKGRGPVSTNTNNTLVSSPVSYLPPHYNGSTTTTMTNTPVSGFKGTAIGPSCTVHNNTINSNTAPIVISTPGQSRVPVSSEMYPLVPLSRGGHIYNYPPLYTVRPLPPFSMPASTTPRVPATTEVSSEPFAVGTDLSSGASRKEKIEKYRQKRSKRNFNRPVDQARRERAQQRVRDELGHFVPSKRCNSPGSPYTPISPMSQEESSPFSGCESTQYECSPFSADGISGFPEATELFENRMLWGTVPPGDVFNTLNPNSTYSEAFKEKVDLSNIELTFTDSPFFDQMKPESQFGLMDHLIQDASVFGCEEEKGQFTADQNLESKTHSTFSRFAEVFPGSCS